MCPDQCSSIGEHEEEGEQANPVRDPGICPTPVGAATETLDCQVILGETLDFCTRYPVR
jgi:hypothetical protein